MSSDLSAALTWHLASATELRQDEKCRHPARPGNTALWTKAGGRVSPVFYTVPVWSDSKIGERRLGSNTIDFPSSYWVLVDSLESIVSVCLFAFFSCFVLLRSFSAILPIVRHFPLYLPPFLWSVLLESRSMEHLTMSCWEWNSAHPLFLSIKNTGLCLTQAKSTSWRSFLHLLQAK